MQMPARDDRMRRYWERVHVQCMDAAAVHVQCGVLCIDSVFRGLQAWLQARSTQHRVMQEGCSQPVQTRGRATEAFKRPRVFALGRRAAHRLAMQ